MTKGKSDLLSAFGTGFEAIRSIINAVLDLGGDDDDFRELLRDEHLQREVAKLVVARRLKAVRVCTRESLDSFTWFEPTYAELQKTFGWVHEAYAQNAVLYVHRSCNGHQLSRDLRLVNLDFGGRPRRSVLIEEVVAKMAVVGCRPAYFTEFVTYAKHLASIQLSSGTNVVALGNHMMIEGEACSPSLYRRHSTDHLSLGFVSVSNATRMENALFLAAVI